MLTIDLEYFFEQSKDNYLILKIKKDNKEVYIGSKYRVKADIDKFLKQFNKEDNKDNVFIIYGAGAGEHIKAAAQKYKKSSILVFEPNINVFNYMVQNKVFEKYKNINLISCEIDDLSIITQQCITEINIQEVEIKCFANYDKIYIGQYQEFLQEIKRCLLYVILNTNTKIGYSIRWFETLMANLKYIAKGIPAELYEDKYKNKPAVIVSAGPSLEKNIEELRGTNAIIISGGRTLRSLIDKGIQPDLLAVVDPNQVSYDLCQGYLENLNKPLLFSDISSEKVVAEHNGKKLFFSENECIKKICKRELKTLMTGGSVAHIMTSYAIMLGCNPIIFIGQDLAYTNEKSHAAIAQNRDGLIGFKQLKREDDIYVEDINGNPVRTSLMLNEYRRYLETIINLTNDVEFINATEGGANIKGTVNMTLKEALEKYKCDSFNKFEEIEYPVNIKENAIVYLNKTLEASKNILNKYKKAIQHLEEIKYFYKSNNVSKVDSLINKIDKIDKEVNKEYSKISLLDSLMYPIIVDTLKNKNKVRNRDEQIEENKKFYLTIIDRLEYAIKGINETINELKNMEEI